MANPTVTVEIAFTTQPGATPTWTNVSTYFVSASVRRGRNNELDSFSTGTCQLILDNPDNRFSPSDTSSPYSPNVKPMKRIRVRATHNSITYGVFHGFVDSWQPVYGTGGRNNQVAVDCSDGFKVLALAKIQDQLAKEIKADAPKTWFRFDEMDTTAQDASGNNNHGRHVHHPKTDVAGVNPSSHAFQAEEADSSYLLGPASAGVANSTSTSAFTVEMWINSSVTPDYARGAKEVHVPLFSQRSPYVATASLDIYLDGLGEVCIYSGSTAANGLVRVDGGLLDGNWHHIAWTNDKTATIGRLFVDGVQKFGGTTNSHFTANQTASQFTLGADPFYPGLPQRYSHATAIDEFAIYTTALSPTRVQAHYAAGVNAFKGQTPGARIGAILDDVGWPAADRTLDTGNTVLRRYQEDRQQALDHLKEVQETENGRIWIDGDGKVRFQNRYATNGAASLVTVGDGTGEVLYQEISTEYGEQAIRNRCTVTVREGRDHTVENATSIADYYRREMSRPSLALDENTADDLATFLVTRFGAPRSRIVSVTLDPAADADLMFPHVLGRQIGDVITVKRRPPGSNEVITQVSVIESISHDLVSPQRWRTSWGVSENDTTSFFKVGSSLLGGADVLAY